MTGFSVIIPTYNHARFIAEAIDSVLSQSLPPVEVLVVDDGSTDGTPHLLDSYGNRIRALRQENRGVSAARNRGIAEAKGDCLAFLDADDSWRPRKLELQRLALEADPEVGLVHCGVEEVDDRGATLRVRLDGRQGWVADEMLFFGPGVILGGGSAAAVRAHIVRLEGGFDESLSTSADWDLYQRIARRARVAFVREPLVRYRRHGSNMHANIAVMEKDMLSAYRNVFAAHPELTDIRRRAYASLHSMLAGSFFDAGQRRKGMRHLARAVACRPSTLLRGIRGAIRRIQG